MRKIEPAHVGECPEGYEYIRGYHEKSGIYVRPFCRKIRKTVVKIKAKIDYPGDTRMTASVRQGLKYSHVSETIPTEDFLTDSGQKKITENLVNALED